MPARNAQSGDARLRPRPLGEEIAGVMQAEIIGGRYRPGQRLVERELTARFGASSIPVREALRELESRGLIVRQHNRGCTVIELSREEGARICELRRVLEPRVAAWAAERITPAAAGLLRKQYQRVARAAAQRDLPGFFQEDVLFHRMIWDAADNPFAARALESMLGSLFASGLIGSREAAGIDLGEEARKHKRLLDALCGRDAKGAAAALLEIARGFERHVR